MNILAPVPVGSGARVLHDTLADGIEGYRVTPYSPWWTLMPPVLPLFSSSKADLLHAAADYGLFFKRPGIPLVVTLHNYVCDRFMRPYSTRLQYLHYRSDLRWFTRRTLLLADRVVAISHFVMERVQDDLGLKTRMRLIYNGVDEQRFVPLARTQRARRCFRILFCGNLSRRKRPQLLVPLANSLGQGFEIQYTAGLAGADSLADSPAAGAARLVNLGSVCHADMPAVYRGVDALFMPSVREGFGLCVAEAMACGLPVVAADSSALPELVSHGAGGYLCPVDDLPAYVRAIRSLAESPQLRLQMGEFNRARVEARFTLARMSMEYRRLFEETISSSVARRGTCHE